MTNWVLEKFDHNGSAADMDELTISNPSSNFTTSTDKRGLRICRFMTASYIIIESLAFKNARSRLSDIFAGRKGVSADTALRFERYLGISAALLIRLQAEYDLSKAVADKGPQIIREILPAPKLAMA